MIRIEFEPAVRTTCDCCGGASTRLTRFVYEDDDAYGVYYASFSDKHPEVKAIVSVGEWWEGTTPADRAAFPMILWQTADDFAVTLVDAAESPWKDVALLGHVLDREEALTHPRVKDAYHVTDHIFEQDPEIRSFFATGT